MLSSMDRPRRFILVVPTENHVGWRIVISPNSPQDSPSRYHSAMRNLAVLFIHFVAVLACLLGPGGVRSLVAESHLLKHQILILNRSRKRSPHLHSSDRIPAGLMALLVRPTGLLRSSIVLKPSTLLALHKSMSKGQCRMLFSPSKIFDGADVAAYGNVRIITALEFLQH